MGPTMEWSTQKPADPIEIRIYPGADGDFTLYEDENDNYNYVKGQHATVQFHWNDQTRTLNIAARQGTFPGMLEQHKFNIVVVGDGHGIGTKEAVPARSVDYSGNSVEVKP